MESGVGGIAPRLGAVIAEELIRRRQKIDQDELEFSRLAAVFAETDEYDEQGFDSPISWIKTNCHMTGGAAADRICVGEQVQRLERSSAAMAAGGIGFPHFALIARTSAAVGERLNEVKLLREATRLSVARFRNACMHARHAADSEAVAAEEAQGAEARSLTLTTADDGVVLVNGILDKVGGAALRTALEPLARRAGRDDDRHLDRRMADALVDVAMHALDTGLVPQRTHLQVTTSLETLLGLGGAPAAEMVVALPISAKAVERLASLGQGGRETGVRLQHHSNPARLGLDGDRRRAREAEDLRSNLQGAQGPGPRMRVARLRPAGELDVRTPSRALDPWRTDEPAQPRPSLLQASHDGA